MIKYYAYYSYGGFKDMLAGSQQDAADCNFYLPLVESGFDTDPAKKDVPKIKILGGDEPEMLPKGMSRLVSNGGYTVFFSRSMNGKCVLIVRDIEGTETDESGRSIPFVMELAGDAEDVKTLAAAAVCILTDTDAADRIFGPLFHYDASLNGLCFETGKLSEWLDIIEGDGTAVVTAGGEEIDLLKQSKPGVLATTLQSGHGEQLTKLGLAPSETIIVGAGQLAVAEPKTEVAENPIETEEHAGTPEENRDDTAHTSEAAHADKNIAKGHVEKTGREEPKVIKASDAEISDSVDEAEVIRPLRSRAELKRRNAMTAVIISGGVIALAIAAVWLLYVKK